MYQSRQAHVTKGETWFMWTAVVIRDPPNVWGSGSAGNTKGKVWLLLIKPHEKQQFSFPAFQIIGDAIGLINRATLEIPYLGLSIMWDKLKESKAN